MAKELDTRKKSSEPTSDESAVTGTGAAKKEKSEKPAKDSKSAQKPAKKKRSIKKFFKDAKSEFKKVVWPTPKETTHNTVVVIIVCVLAGLVIFGLDSLFGLLNNLVFHG